MSETTKPATELDRTPFLRAVTSRSARRWSNSAAGRCRCSTPPASSRSTSRRAAAPGSSTCRTWGASCSAARRPAVPPARADQQRGRAGPAAGAVHDVANARPAGRWTTRTCTASSRTSTCSWSTPPTASRTGSTSRTHLRLPRRGADRRDRRDRDARAAGPCEPRHPGRPHRDRDAPGPVPQRAELRDARAAGSVQREAPPRGDAHRADRLHRRAAVLRAVRRRRARAGPVGRARGRRAPRRSGLGARDTLRLEAGLPLYGHELGLDPSGRKSRS